MIIGSVNNSFSCANANKQNPGFSSAKSNPFEQLLKEGGRLRENVVELLPSLERLFKNTDLSVVKQDDFFELSTVVRRKIATRGMLARIFLGQVKGRGRSFISPEPLELRENPMSKFLDDYSPHGRKGVKSAFKKAFKEARRDARAQLANSTSVKVLRFFDRVFSPGKRNRHRVRT